MRVALSRALPCCGRRAQVSRVFPKHSDTDDLAAVVEFLHAE